MKHHAERLAPYPSEPDVTAHGEVEPIGLERDLQRQFVKSIDNLVRLIQDRSHRVDEYQPQELTNTVSSMQTTPDYEIDEIITSIIVTGTPAAAFTLNVGKRQWNLTMTASGILVIGPIQISLGRYDNRVLTSATPGNWTLELCGHTETKFRWLE